MNGRHRTYSYFAITAAVVSILAGYSLISQLPNNSENPGLIGNAEAGEGGNDNSTGISGITNTASNSSNDNDQNSRSNSNSSGNSDSSISNSNSDSGDMNDDNNQNVGINGGGGRGGSRGGGGGGNGENANDDQSITEHDNDLPMAWLRVDDHLVIGQPVTAYLLTTYNGPGVATFRGFHEPDCTKGSGIPCETLTDSDGSAAPTYVGDIPGACAPCYEYKVTFSEDTFVKGENHIDAIIMDGDRVIAAVGGDFIEHSFFVLPDSPVGPILTLLSSVAAIAGYWAFKGRRYLRSRTR